MKQYGDTVVLNIKNLSIRDGELIGLVGNNGAGKTTFLRLLLDLIKANNGHVLIDGKNVNQDESWKSFSGSYLDSSFLVDFYTPEEFFEFIAEVYKIPEPVLSSRLSQYEALMNGEILGARKLIHDFSNGNRQKIGIIGAMLINPRLLILDEPFNYLDPSSQIIVARMIQSMNKELGTTVIVSSHNLVSINDICTRILLLEKGEIIMDKEHMPGKDEMDLNSYFLDAIA